MSKEFKPIHNEHGNMSNKSKPANKSISEQLIECREAYERLKELYEREVGEYKKKSEDLKRERDVYMEENKRLKEELSALKERVEELERELYEEKLKENVIKSVCETTKESISSKKLEISREMTEVSKIALKKLVLSDYIPHEEIIGRVLTEIFDRSLELSGALNIYVSKEDIVRVEGSINMLKTQIPELQINLLVDENLKEGEIKVETEKFWIERKYDDIVEDIIDEVLKGEGHTSDLREGS